MRMNQDRSLLLSLGGKKKSLKKVISVLRLRCRREPLSVSERHDLSADGLHGDEHNGNDEDHDCDGDADDDAKKLGFIETYGVRDHKMRTDKAL